MDKVLIIEDDNMIGEMMTMYLSEEGYSVKRTDSGLEGLLELERFRPDVVLLDLVLPDMNGIELCSKLRSATLAPIIVVSMKMEVSDRINALQAGADDFLSKPFSMRELTARINANIRRTHLYEQLVLQRDHRDVTSEMAEIIVLDSERRSLYVNQRYVETTFSEFEIMKLFCANQGKVYTREELINTLRGFDSFVTDRAIDVHIANLRKKIEENPKEPKFIKTVWGVGYKFNVHPE
ncbi:DNA-binding response regulator [Paenibacillus selenitireducens]|uniref:DNA-binding response regulator n=1 Tax=Paenibacillus selenitireducens TaxID=1324314 RepID=A0A1T2XCD8_9BACL|nr:response regulator transcription factor [Paenibacillus selenitireducens]OPA77559.1 DNA-binding response regulator [Paenibacillus selenitireducens]